MDVKVGQWCRNISKFCLFFDNFRSYPDNVRELRTSCPKSRNSVSREDTCRYRLYKPFARKPWLTVYRAPAGILSSVARFLCEDLVSGSMSSVAFASETFELGQGRSVVSQNIEILSKFQNVRRCPGVARRLRICCQTSRVSVLRNIKCRCRLYKPLAR